MIDFSSGWCSIRSTLSDKLEAAFQDHIHAAIDMMKLAGHGRHQDFLEAAEHTNLMRKQYQTALCNYDSHIRQHGC